MPRPQKVKEYYPPRLMASLRGISEYCLTAVCAPSGSGKTTSLREYFARQQKRGVRLLWYASFGETQDTGWARICDLFAEVDPDTAAQMKKLGFPVRQNLSLLAELIQNLRCDTETVFVIDNAQLFCSDIPHELLCVLSMHQAERLHIVIITQTRLDTPEIPLNAPGVLFIGAEAFLFTAEESDAYFKLNGVDLTAHELGQVMDNTLGWIAPLQLQLRGYRQSGIIQREASIDQLLQTVVWNALGEEERGVLQALSFLEAATPHQVCVLLGMDQMPEYASRLLNHGGFIAYDRQQDRYVMHQIFREFAQKRARELPQHEQKTLLCRAAEVYKQDGMAFPAMQCLLRAEEYAAIMALPLTNADMSGYGTQEVVAVLRQVLAACPRQVLADNPAKLIRFAFELLMRGESGLYRQTCVAIDASLQSYTLEGEERRRELQGEYVFLRSFEHVSDVKKMHALHLEAFEALGGHSKAFDHQRYWTFGIPSALTLFWTGEGSLAQQMAFFAKAMPTYIQLSGGHGTGAAQLMQAEAALHAGDLDDAETLCHKTVFLAGDQHQDTLCFGAYLTLGRIAILRGDCGGYLAALRDIHGLALTGREKSRHTVAGQCTALLEMGLGRLENLPDWLVDEKEIRNQMYESSLCYAMRLHAKQLLIKRDYRRLIGYAEPLLERALRQRARMLVIYYHVYLACAKHAIGALPEAVGHLKAAMEIALPSRVYLPFAEHHEALAPVLAKIHSSTHMADIERVASLGEKQRAGAEKVRHSLYGRGEKLTPREEEMAKLAQKGYTNKKIASILSVSPETVKITLQKVLKKLQIHSRQQLIDKNL